MQRSGGFSVKPCASEKLGSPPARGDQCAGAARGGGGGRHTDCEDDEIDGAVARGARGFPAGLDGVRLQRIAGDKPCLAVLDVPLDLCVVVEYGCRTEEECDGRALL